jgi:phosphatidate cytidylyltransferase
MLKTRILTSVCLLPVIIIAVWFDEPLPWFTLIVGIAGILASYEFFRLTSVRSNLGLTIFGLVFTLLLIIRPHCTYYLSLPIIIGACLFISFLITFFQRNKPYIYNNWLWMLLGSIYIGWLLSLLILVRNVPGTDAAPEIGRNLVFLTLFTVFGSDTLAYFVGRSCGHHQMASRISPNKTWEGAAGGAAGGMIIALLFTANTPLHIEFSIWQAVIFGFSCSLFGQFGDLAESALKRAAGAKDSGIIFPGHGGILDRIDSLLLAVIVTYISYIFFF